jgi:hypothetical protein
MERTHSQRVELAVSDQSQLGPLQQFLRWATPDAGVSRITGQPDPGEQGAPDVQSRRHERHDVPSWD